MALADLARRADNGGANRRRRLAAGTLAAGARLPSSRLLARDLGVSRITVTTAYAEPEADGVIGSRAGAGTAEPVLSTADGHS